MRRRRRGWRTAGAGLAGAIGLAAVLVLSAWAVAAGPGGRWTAGSAHVLIAMALAVTGAGGLAAGLMWLAFFSARRGYDDRADFRLDDPDGPWR